MTTSRTIKPGLGQWVRPSRLDHSLSHRHNQAQPQARAEPGLSSNVNHSNSVLAILSSIEEQGSYYCCIGALVARSGQVNVLKIKNRAKNTCYFYCISYFCNKVGWISVIVRVLSETVVLLMTDGFVFHI